MFSSVKYPHHLPCFNFIFSKGVDQTKENLPHLIPHTRCRNHALCFFLFGIGVPVDKKPRPQREQAVNCPRCNSTNTKFCYYNNYSLSQPRYFCKTCRRYWTEGGTLRNVPVGGGSRKKHRSSSSSSSSKKVVTNLSPPKISPQNPKIHDGQDLNLAYIPPIYNGVPELVALPFALQTQSPSFAPSNSSHLPFMELLKSAGNYTSAGLSSLISPISPPVSGSNPVFTSGFPMHEFKSFTLDGLENNNGFGSFQSAVENPSRIGFPFEEPKAGSDQLGQDRGNQVGSNGYWNGMLPGGSW